LAPVFVAIGWWLEPLDPGFNAQRDAETGRVYFVGFKTRKECDFALRPSHAALEASMTRTPVTLYHSPNTRSSTIVLLLEELDTPYQVHLLNQKKGEQHAPAYLALNPLGKVPALTHDGAVITETVAIMLYLADAFPAAKLAPAIGDALRGPYLRWMMMYAAAWEPAVVDRAMKREPGMRGLSTYGDFDALFQAVAAQLLRGPYFLGETFTAADVLWGSALRWMTMFKLVPEHQAVDAYLARVSTRPALARLRAKDKGYAALQA
jgi:glutathione S-transferase